MAAPDATAAWLQQVPAAVQAQASRHADAAVLAWALGWGGALLVGGLMMRSGLLARAWTWGERRGPWQARLAVIALFALISSLVDVAAGAVAAQKPPQVADFASDLALRLVEVGVGYAVLGVSLSRPRLAFGVLAVLVGFALALGPDLLLQMSPPRGRPAPPAIAEAVRRVAANGGITVVSVEVSSAVSGEGDVVGAPAPRVYLPDDAAIRSAPAEVKARVGHLLGHYRCSDTLVWGVVLSGLGLGLVLFVAGLTEPVGRWLGWRESWIGDARSLPVVWMLVVTWLALAGPAALAFDRYINMRADRFSLDHAREPDALIRTLIRQAGSAPVDPPIWQRLIACSHPPLKDRIAQALRWKAAHGVGG